LAHEAESNGRREADRVQQSAEHVSGTRQPTTTAAPHFSVPISSPGTSPSTASSPKESTRLPKYPSPPPTPKSVTPEPTPQQIRAAMTIQEFYRSRTARAQALTSIADFSAQFERLKSAFSPPPQLDYRGSTPDDATTAPVPPESFERAPSIPPSSNEAEDTTETLKSHPGLGFTSNNKVVLEYIEDLNRLVDKLDRVESGGDPSVREQRKQMITSVEAELQRMDRWIATVWELAQQSAQAQSKPRSSRQLRPQPTMEDVFADN